MWDVWDVTCMRSMFHGAAAFDQEEYRRAMAGLRKGRMLPSDLEGMEFDAHAS